uniref:IPT/TIG domain-containing protein n=1 Tax=Solibacter usitatus (strain Ellin6076) TaxID=234267 RepID=Q01T37_SOLUE
MLLALLALSLTYCLSAQVSVTTYRNNLARTGENLAETVLTPANVNPSQFGKLFSRPVDGQIYAQPLYLPSVAIPGKGVHNVVFVATQHDSVYAFDADSNTGSNESALWQVSLANAGAGETPAGVADVLNCLTITPEVGITGTPVIDPSTNTLYVVAMTKRDTLIFHRLHALDVTSGAERPGSPVSIAASVPGTGDRALSSTSTTVTFDAYFYKNRAGLLLLNGVVYTGWTSHCDSRTYHGWIIAYDARSLQQVAVYNTTPDGYQGSIWMGGAAPAADSEGNIYAVSGNGRFDADVNGRNLGDSVIKLSSPALSVLDFFTPFNQLHLDQQDVDLGSGGAVLLPDLAGSPDHKHLLVNAGKEGRVYLLDRDRMGRFNSDRDSQIVQSLEHAIGAHFGGPAYFNGTLYFSASYDRLKAFSVSGAHIGIQPASQSSLVFDYPGAVPSVSASGSSNAIVWVIESDYGGTLHAYDASNLAVELYNSHTNTSRDALGSFVRFSVPTTANAKVYVGTKDSLAVFGLLNQPSVTAVVNAASLLPGSVAPGSLITILGSRFAGAPMVAPTAQLPHTLGGVTLSVNGISAPLLFIGPDQINAQVPFEVTPGAATAVLQLAGMPPISFPLEIAAAAPGLFPGIRPAAVGSTVTVYLTGQGAVLPQVSTGEPAPAAALAQAVFPVTATLGNRQATVTLAALSPDSAGLFQVNLVVPALRPGSHPLVVTVNGVSSNTRSVTVDKLQR